MNKLPLDMDLKLPDAPDFISKPPQYSLAEIIRLSEPLLPFWNSQRAAQILQISTRVVCEPFRLIEDSTDLNPPAK